MHIQQWNKCITFFLPPQKKKKKLNKNNKQKQSKTKNLAFLRGVFCSRTTPVPPETIFHRIKIKPNYCPPGPRSLGQLSAKTTPHQGHYKPMKPLIRTNTYTVGNCPGGELSGYRYSFFFNGYLSFSSRRRLVSSSIFLTTSWPMTNSPGSTTPLAVSPLICWLSTSPCLWGWVSSSDPIYRSNSVWTMHTRNNSSVLS